MLSRAKGTPGSSRAHCTQRGVAKMAGCIGWFLGGRSELAVSLREATVRDLLDVTLPVPVRALLVSPVDAVVASLDKAMRSPPMRHYRFEITSPAMKPLRSKRS